MIYAIIEKDRQETLFRFDTWDELHRETFNPDSWDAYTAQEIPAKISGRSYQERKANAYDTLVNMQYILGAPGLYMSEYADIGADAERIARRYGLLAEARENGIC